MDLEQVGLSIPSAMLVWGAARKKASRRDDGPHDAGSSQHPTGGEQLFLKNSVSIQAPKAPLFQSLNAQTN